MKRSPAPLLIFIFGFLSVITWGRTPVWAGVAIDEFAIPTPISGPTGITAGPDGNIWFCESEADQIGRVDPQGTNFQEFPLPNAGSLPEEITVGPDGNLWFTEENGNRIGRITPEGQINEFNIPTFDSQPEDIVTGPDGNLWFTELDGNKVARITPEGVITEFPLMNADSFPTNIIVGPDGNLWFTETDRNGRITPDGQITEFDYITSANGWGIALGPDGNLWYCASNGVTGAAYIGRMTPEGTVTEFPLANFSKPLSIVAGEDGFLYFTENENNKIGRVTTEGVITLLNIPTADSDPFVITVGPQGNIWFTESAANQLGKLLLPGVLQFPMADFTVNENSGMATISVSRTAGNGGPVSVNFSTSDGTAIAGQDYVANSGTLTWQDGDSADKTFTVTILNNGDQGGARTVNLSLSSPTGDATLGALAQAFLTILDDDGGGGCSLSQGEPTTHGFAWMGLFILMTGLFQFRPFQRKR